tara:strand:- start:21 stop:605 length:585 start_codon:yes stop_codon:yes gene_type:complete
MKQQKMPNKEIIVDITLQDCYTCSVKQITVIRNILGTIHEDILDLQIPQGMSTKKKLTYIEKGDQTEEYSIPGDLDISFNIINDPEFKKYGEDLIFEKTILLSEALYGCSFDLTLPDQTCLQFISKNIIRPRMTKQYNGLGFPNKEGIRGDLHILFKIEFPQTLLDKQRELLYKLLPKRKKEKKHIDYTDVYMI